MGFAVLPVAAALGIGEFAAGVIVYGGVAAASIGLNYVANKLLTSTSASGTSEVASGSEITLRIGGDVAQSLIVGRAVTAGSLCYAATFGRSGTTENSNLIEVIALADHPCVALEKVFVAGEEATLLASGSNGQDAQRGYIVDGWSNNVALAFYDGSQTTADPFAVSKLLTAENPWTAQHVGIGRTYLRPHLIYDQERVTGRLEWKAVVKGVRLYDPRKDSTAGGSGAHRFDDLATHEWSQNIPLIIYNILRGIYVRDGAGARQFFYGLENSVAAQFPPDVWFAAMNEADVAIDLAAGGTEPQFVGGAEITVDTEPLAAIRELLKACGGRLVENGGVYKLYVGAPGLPVATITDGDLLASEGDDFAPVLGLEDRINYITGTYTSPADGWINDAVAVPIENTTWRDEDGRRLAAELAAPAVQSATQMQRLLAQMLNRARRQRKHTLPLGPAYFALEPGDIIAWTSERNGYDGKLFEVDSVGYHTNLCVTLQITEVDPADYDWSTADETTVPDGRVITTRPAPKIVDGIDAEAYTDVGDSGTKRPAIRLTWTDPEDGDVSGIGYELRATADPVNITANSALGADIGAAGELIIRGGLQPVTSYDVRARFLSANGYPSAWTLWQTVVTPDTRTIDEWPTAYADFITVNLADQLAEIRAAQKWLTEAVTQALLHIPESKRVLRDEDKWAEGRLSASIAVVKTLALDTAQSYASYQILINSQLAGDASSGLLNAIDEVTANVAVNYYTKTQSDAAFAGLAESIDARFAGETGTTLSASISSNADAIATQDATLSGLATSVDNRFSGATTTGLKTSITDLSSNLTNNYYTKITVDGTFSALNTSIDNRFSGATTTGLKTSITDLAANLSTNYYTKTNINTTLAGYSTAASVDARFAGTTSTALSASVETNADAIATLDGYAASRYTIKLDTNGYFSGIELFNGGSGQSYITFKAGALKYIATTGGAPVDVFVAGLVNGVARTVFYGNLIGDGTIYGRSIIADEIDTQHFKIGSVDFYTILAGAVSSSAYVEGGNSSAITIPGNYVAGSKYYGGNQYVVLATAVVPEIRNGHLKVDIFAVVNVVFPYGAYAFFSLVLKQDGVIIKTWEFSYTLDNPSSPSYATFGDIRQMWIADVSCAIGTNSVITLEASLPGEVTGSDVTIAAGSIRGNIMRPYEITK